MLLHHVHAVFCVISGLHLAGLYAYPTLNIPFLLSSEGGRYKKSGLDAQADADVLELEYLKRNHRDETTVQQYHSLQPQQTQDGESNVSNADNEELLPALDRQLELAMPEATKSVLITSSESTLSSTVFENASASNQKELSQAEQGMHRPPTLPHNDGGKAPAEHTAESTIAGSGTGVPSMAKPFYSAARLAFGQNPEVLPTISSVSTSTISTTTGNIITSTQTYKKEEKETREGSLSGIEAGETKTGEHIDTLSSETTSSTHTEHPLSSEQSSSQAPSDSVLIPIKTKETVDDVVVVDDLEDTIKTTARRSVTLVVPKTAETLLKQPNGRYSSFDMAEYVFWTGDEAGVARAVEELIDSGAMTRENALKFLRDIRFGIEYLQQSYTNRIFPDAKLRGNNVKKSYPLLPITIRTTSATPITTTTEKPVSPYVPTHLDRPFGQNGESIAKTLDNISMWHKLQELNNDAKQDLGDYDEAGGKAKIAEFLYTEYTLEEILYKLAKIMFERSLAHGSDEAQQELQKLTAFLEREGNLGVIPIDLQKKVLHILLRALSDTLSDHPELLQVARLNLANPYTRLPMHSFGP